MSEILKVEKLHVRYGEYEAVKGVSFALAKGGILGIVGESGSGKSTIAKVLMGLHKDYSGTITFNLQPSTFNLRSKIAMIFQDAVGSLNPRMTVGQTLREVLQHSNRKIVKSRKIVIWLFRSCGGKLCAPCRDRTARSRP